MNANIDHPRPRARVLERRGALAGLGGLGGAESLFLLAAGISFLLSVSLYFSGSQQQGIYVGLWVPSILSAGTLLLGRNGGE